MSRRTSSSVRGTGDGAAGAHPHGLFRVRADRCTPHSSVTLGARRDPIRTMNGSSAGLGEMRARGATAHGASALPWSDEQLPCGAPGSAKLREVSLSPPSEARGWCTVRSDRHQVASRRECSIWLPGEESCERFGGDRKPEPTAGSVVELLGDGGHVEKAVRDHSSIGQVFPGEFVRVLIRGPMSRGVGAGEVPWDPGGQRRSAMQGHLTARSHAIEFETLHR